MINKLQTQHRKTKRWFIVLLMMASSILSFGQTTYYSKASATDFNDVTSWGTSTDGTGTSPSTISDADFFVIQNASALSLTGNATVRRLTINSGSLTIAANTLNVAIPLQYNSTFNLAGGTLTVSGGTLNVNGNFIVASSAIFNQSGGSINVDGNDAGASATSVASGTYIVSFSAASLTNISLTGGTFTIVDPHYTTTTTLYATITPVGSIAAGPAHTFRFGNGISTDNGGTNGFLFYSWNGSGIFKFGNVVLEPVTAGTNRFVYTTGTFYNFVATGDVTINSGAELRCSGTAATAATVIGGDLNVNTGGTYTSAGITYFGDATSSSSTALAFSASTRAQAINNLGTIRNTTGTVSANLASLTINNTSASGVTLNAPLSVGGTLTLTAGRLNTTANNSLRLGTLTAAGTLSGGSSTAYINGPFQRTFAASRTASGTYSATTLFPVGKPGRYLPVWVDPSTNSGGAVILSAEGFTGNTGTTGTGVTSVSGSRWEAGPVSGNANFTGSFIQLSDSTLVTSAKKILQATSASGVYDAIPSPTTFTSGPPSTIRTATQLAGANFTGYISYGDVTPCTTPLTQASAFQALNTANTSFSGSFTASPDNPTGYLVVRYATGATPTAPVNGTLYAASASLGTGTVVGMITGTTFTQTGLTASATYDYYIYAYNNGSCSGPSYNTNSPLTGSVTMCASAVGTPTISSAVNLTPMSFTARWNKSSTVGATYILDLSTSATFATFVPGYQALSVIDTFYNFSGVNTAATYYYRVRAVSSNCYSPVSGTATVNIPCYPLTSLPWSENFDTITTIGAAVLPPCWSTTTGTKAWTSANTATTTYNAPYTTPNYVNIAYSNTVASVLWAPGFQLTAGSTYEFSFYYNTATYSGFTGNILVNTIPDATGAVSTAFLTSTQSTSGYTLYKYYYTPSGSGTYYFGLSVTSTSAPWYLGVDNFNLEQKNCIEPVLAQTIVTGPATATVRWKGTSPAPSGGYEVYVSASRTAPTALTTPTAYAPSDTFSATNGLAAATWHYTWVRSNCGGAGTSSWSVVDSFLTDCNPVTAITENFSAVTTPALPACWKKVSTTGSVLTQTADAFSTPNCLYIYSGSTTDVALLSLPPLSNAGAGTHWLTLKARANYTVGGVIQVGYLTTPGNAASFVSVQSFTAASLTYQTYTVDLGTAPGLNTVLALRHTGSPANSVLIDDISWEPKPSCIAPAIGKTIVTGTATATVRWTASTSSPTGGYEVYVSASNTAPTSLTTPTAYAPTDTFAAVSGLAAATLHYAWVRSNCGGAGTSSWSIADSFITECLPVTTLPYIEDFNSVAAGNLPICTSREDVNNDGRTWTTVVTPTAPTGITGNVLRYIYSTTNVANDWFFTAGIALTGGTSYRLKFNFGNNDATYVEKLKVMYGTSASGAAMTNLIFDSANISGNVLRSAQVDFTPSVSGTYYIGFQAYSIADQFYLYVDDINLNLTPMCGDVTGLSVKALAPSVTLAWNGLNPAPASGYDYYISTSSTTPSALASPTGNTADTFATVSLPPNTPHYAWVRSNCGGVAGNWSPVLNFSTAVNALPYTQDFEAGAAGWTSALVSGSVNDWALGTPAKTNINGAHSGTQAWVTKLSGNYSAYLDAAVVSPQLDFSSVTTTPVLRFYHKFIMEDGYDANVVEISINGGTWMRLDSTLGTGVNYNTLNSYAWYNNSSTNGRITPAKFSGNTTTGTLYASASSGWIQSATYLTGAAGQSNVRIRFRANSDVSDNYEGWAIDDIEIVEVVAPASPASSVSATPANTSASLSWTNGNGEGRIVVARLTTAAAVAPADLTLYRASGVYKGVGSDSTGTGNYVVYNGTGNTANVTGLQALTGYSFDVYEYNGKYMHVRFTSAASSNTTTTPVKLLSFEGRNEKGNAELSWVTANERNNAGFEVQRSVDGRQFEKAGFVKGAGNSAVGLRYAFTDSRAFAQKGVNKLYYRLKQVDNNNAFEYSAVIAVTEEVVSAFNVTAFPVPFHAGLALSIESGEQGTGRIEVADIQGKVIHSREVSLVAGSNEVSLNNLDELQAGVYFVKVVQQNQSKVIRVVKSK